MSSPGSRNGQAHGSPQGRPILRVGRKGFFIGRASGCRATLATPRDSSPPPVCLSYCVGRGGVPARVIQVTLIYCILHVAGTGNGSKTGASGKPLSLTCVRGNAPRGAGDPPSCMRHKASVQAASHAPHLRAATITPTYCTSPPASSRPCIMTHSARDILACRHAMPLTTTPLMAPAPCRLVECPTTDAVARVPRPCRATQGWRLPTPNRKARR